MIGVELLNNLGVQYIGNKKVLDKKEKTLIVLGVARGGTSLVAGALDMLGVFTGDESRKPVYEDTKLAKFLEAGDLKQAQAVIADYNIREHIWSFKRPVSVNYVNTLCEVCRNPVFLIIFKDIFSISNRNKISMQGDVVSELEKAYDAYGKIVSFVREESPNAFLLSYEKIMQNKEMFVDLLIDLIGVDSVSQEQKIATLDFIEPNPEEYLRASRITHGVGQIGSVSKDKVVGWGKYIYSDDTALVELYINDVLVDTVEAKDFRQHALDDGKHSTGHCGYVFHLKEHLKDGDKVSVKLSEDINFLAHSHAIWNSK